MSLTLIYKAAYLVGLLAQLVFRAPYRRATAKNKISDSRTDRTEAIVLGLLFLGNFLIPLVYIFTPWLDVLNYSLLAWAGWIGILILAGSLVIFWRGHADLGLNWSPTIAIREDQTLVTRGIYAYIRHPMYASQWLWVIAQPLLLQNWLAGPIGILVFALLYFTRVSREEKMMQEHFGDKYRAYMTRTGRIIPRSRHSG